MLVAGSTTIVIVLDVLEHVPALVIVHSKILVPNERLVTVLFAAKLLVKIPVPDNTDQLPTPVVGVLADSAAVGLVIQTV